MANVFSRLIKKEFGDVSYRFYFGYYRKNIYNKQTDSGIVFSDMYNKLATREDEEVLEMRRRLNETLLSSLNINRRYVFAFFGYIFAAFYLIGESLLPTVTVAGLVLMSICFIYKSHEFIANKFCYIDARIVLVYKSAIEAVLVNRGKNYTEE